MSSAVSETLGAISASAESPCGSTSVAGSSGSSPALSCPSSALRLRAVLCHHKCASTWLWRDVMMSLALRAGATTASLNSSWREFDEDRLRGVLRFATCIGDLNTSASMVEVLERHASPYRAVHLVRDPRDILVSAYFSHRNTHSTAGWPELVEQRERLRSLSIEDGLLSEIAFNGFVLDALAGWVRRPSILELRYEEVTLDPQTWIVRCVDWLGWPLDPAYLREVVDRYSYEKLAGRLRGEGDSNHHYRKGVAGDWRNHFTDRVKDAFEERYPGLVERMGYDTEGW